MIRTIAFFTALLFVWVLLLVFWCSCSLVDLKIYEKMPTSSFLVSLFIFAVTSFPRVTNCELTTLYKFLSVRFCNDYLQNIWHYYWTWQIKWIALSAVTAALKEIKIEKLSSLYIRGKFITAQKIKFSIKNFFSKCDQYHIYWRNP